MTFKELALSFDVQVNPLEAAWAYEIAIKEKDADLELFLNLAVLYFECVDFGYAAYHHLSENFAAAAGDRAFDILSEAEERFGKHSEIDFWRLYFSLIYLGDKPSNDAWKELASKGDSLVPYLYLFASSGKVKYQEEAYKLLESVKDGATERKRYIKSILE